MSEIRLSTILTETVHDRNVICQTLPNFQFGGPPVHFFQETA